MSFTSEVKNELTRINRDKKCQLAELLAIIRIDGSIQIINKELAVRIKLFHGDLARRIYLLIKNTYGLLIEIIVKRCNKFSNQKSYELVLPPQKGIKELLNELGLLDSKNNLIFRINDRLIEDMECKKAFIRGAFLGGGSVNAPEGECHLEFRCEQNNFALDLFNILKKFKLDGSITKHKGKSVIYFKNFAEVATILNIIGAHQALLKMENIRVVKEVKNNVNRSVNCETANLEKTVRAAIHQLDNIKFIEKNIGLNKLSRGLNEIALLRINNPYASLQELGQLAEPPLSKSAVNHRLRRINMIAEKIRR
jgi:cell division protein WhiA